ncbi:reverse transcriptase domain-containing protein [Tanacetum coccineum]
MTNRREITPPSGFSTPIPIQNVRTSELPPITTSIFVATTPENTPLSYHASTSANTNTIISPAFVEANYEILESLLRERTRQIRNEDLRTELGYFSEEYDKEREMEPRPEQNRETTPPLYMRIESNVEGGGPSEFGARENVSQGMRLPPLLAAHLGRSENGQALQSSLTFVYGGHQPSINIGGNLPPNGTHLSHNAQPFIPSSSHISNGFKPAHVNSYSQPFMGIVNGQALNYPPQAHNERNNKKKEVPKDFLVELPFEEDKKKAAGTTETKMESTKLSNVWKLYTDGASSSDGSGAGLMLINPEGKEYTYALRFKFKTTNNEAEYEALLAGLQIAKQMEIKSLAIFADF